MANHWGFLAAASVAFLLCKGAVAGDVVPVPSKLKYKPLPIYSERIPRSIIPELNPIFEQAGLAPLDEKNEGNIPFYWVDQIYLSPDFSRSAFLKINAELADKRLENKVLGMKGSYAIHTRTKNGVPFAVYFSGFRSPHEVETLISRV